MHWLESGRFSSISGPRDVFIVLRGVPHQPRVCRGENDQGGVPKAKERQRKSAARCSAQRGERRKQAIKQWSGSPVEEAV